MAAWWCVWQLGGLFASSVIWLEARCMAANLVCLCQFGMSLLAWSVFANLVMWLPAWWSG